MKKNIFLILFVVLSFFTLEAKKYEHELAIGAIFRDDAPYLKEWIEFHKIVGVKHFYLYNNVSQDNYLEVLQPYIESGEVELIDWLHEDNTFNGFCLGVQPQAYTDCIQRATGKVRWLALIDTDEFLTPVKKNTVTDVLKSYKKYAGVCFDWQVFGTSNIPSIPENKTMVETLVMKAPKEHPRNTFFKSIVRPEYVEYCPNPHLVIYKKPYYAVDPAKRRMDSKKSQKYRPYVKPLVINHYWTRDENHYYTRKFTQYLRWGPDTTIESFQRQDDELNQVHDTSMQRFIPLLRVKMGFENSLFRLGPF